jgi:hypothetical protein
MTNEWSKGGRKTVQKRSNRSPDEAERAGGPNAKRQPRAEALGFQRNTTPSAGGAAPNLIWKKRPGPRMQSGRNPKVRRPECQTSAQGGSPWDRRQAKNQRSAGGAAPKFDLEEAPRTENAMPTKPQGPEARMPNVSPGRKPWGTNATRPGAPEARHQI